MEEKIGEFEGGEYENSLVNTMKLEHFIEYKNNYQEWEIEYLLKNGKELLKVKL